MSARHTPSQSCHHARSDGRDGLQLTNSSDQFQTFRSEHHDAACADASLLLELLCAFFLDTAGQNTRMCSRCAGENILTVGREDGVCLRVERWQGGGDCDRLFERLRVPDCTMWIRSACESGTASEIARTLERPVPAASSEVLAVWRENDGAGDRAPLVRALACLTEASVSASVTGLGDRSDAQSSAA